MELLFYHLEQATLERVLPDLLSKSLERGWRAIVETNGGGQMEALDTMLWTYSADSFLPHSLVNESLSEDALQNQPILITDKTENINKAHIRFFIDSGDVTVHQGYERLVYIFNGNNEADLKRAREQWKAAKATEIEATYWQQNATGRWEKKA
ncbi:DNA polymerase III subunit chi [Hyphomicrobiales bacterium 4NK60-0047b]